MLTMIIAIMSLQNFLKIIHEFIQFISFQPIVRHSQPSDFVRRGHSHTLLIAEFRVEPRADKSHLYGVKN